MSGRRIDRGDGGFTLVELLVAVMIEGLIVGALAMAFIGILRSGTQVNQSLSRSSDARIAAAYIVNDASNSSGPEVSLTDTTSCADASPPVAGTQNAVVRFDSTITSSSGATKPDIVIYYLVGTSLVRRECQNGALVSDNAVAANVASVNVACSPTANCSGTPTSITVAITETATTSGPPYVYSLTGTFQKTIGAGAPGPPSSVILLGGGTCGATTGINLSGSGKMRVYGDAYLNTKDNGTSCGAITLSGAPTYQAGGTYILNGGTCQAPTYLLPACPTVTNYATAHPDPYATVTAPSTSGRPSQNAATTCQSPGSTAQPGVYSGILSVGSSNTCQLASGVYIFQNGLSVSGAASLTSASGGVLIYITGGSLSVAGSGVVNLSPMTTGQWAGLLIWQDKLDTSTISYSGAGILSLNGALYAPTAEINVAGSAANPMVTALVVKAIVISGASVINVGTPSSPGLSIDAPAVTSWPVNTPFSSTITGSGGDGNFIWSASNLPSPLTIDPDTGTISGTPSATGAKSVTITLNDALGDDPATTTYTLTINALPTVTSATPLGQGATNANVVITGTGFVNGAALDSSFSGTGITVNSTTYNSSTSVTANVTIAAGAATGARNVTVTNGDTGVSTGIGKFIVDASPTVTSVNPAVRGQGSTQTVTITGTGFVSGAALTSSFGSGITVNSTSYTNGTTLSANISIAAGAATGAHDVTVTNGDSGVGTGTGKFTVNAAPAITTSSPLLSGEKSVSQSWTLAASGGTTPYIWTLSSGSLPAGLSLSSAGVISGTPTGSGSSSFGVTVTDALGGTTSANLALTINPQPTITNVQFLNKTAGGTGTAGKIEQGDQIVVTFSAQMNANTICSSWADGTADRTLSSNNNLVTLTNGSGSSTDTMSVTTTACTFHFGTISLGSNAYVATNNATFGTSAGNTTFAWSASTNKLTITLGQQGGTGTTATVTTSTPTFTLSNSVTDPAGAPVSNLTPAFPAAGKQF